MKLKSLISALIVFTLVMTCAMSAVSAASFATTTTYSTSGDVTVNTTATGLEDGAMVSYIIYSGDTITENSIKYIDQKTESSNRVEFSVTDATSVLNGNKIKLGSSITGSSVDATVQGKDDIVSGDSSSTLLVTVTDPLFDDTEGVVFLVNQSGSDAVTGLNIYAKKGDEVVYEFKNLNNASDNTSYYGIELLDDSGEDIFTGVTFEAVPVYNGVEMTKVADTDYWVVTPAAE